MSLKAKGLLTLMLSLPENWDYTINGLVAICKENETAIKSALDELKKLGYLVVTKLKPNETPNGRYGYLYDIYEQPQNEIQEGEKQEVEILPLEILPVENQGQLNTNKSSIKESNTEDIKEKYKKESIDYLAIVNAYKEICTSLPTCRTLSDQRKKAIKARLRSGYTINDFITLFNKAQESDFLKGKNDRNWTATFDWLIKDANMAKVLDGNYDSRRDFKNANENKYKVVGAIEL